MRRDVLIAGAGPAGSTAAILLARSGARVTLIDRARFPREKLCGEFVAPESLRVLARLGVLPELTAIAGKARAVVLSDAAGRTARLPLPAPSGAAPVALGIARREMDALLVERAAREGVEVIEGLEVRAALVGPGGLAAGVLARDRATGRETALEARFLLAADGRDSALARALSPGSAPRRSPLFGLQAHFRSVPALGGAVELHYFQGGYVGLHEIGDGRVNACALIDRSLARPAEKDPEGMARELFFRNAAARARLEGAERVSPWLAVASLVFRAGSPVRAGAIFLGDAAATIDPFAGEGMSMAFRSAEIAAEEIAFPGESDDRIRATYARRWRREFAVRIAVCRTIGRLAARPSVQVPAIAALRALPLAARILARCTRAGVPLAPQRGLDPDRT